MWYSISGVYLDVPCLGENGMMPARFMRPTVGLMPIKAPKLAGRINISVSVPRIWPLYAATDVAGPLIKPQGSWVEHKNYVYYYVF